MEDNITKSAYNEAQHKMDRIDSSQKKISACNLAPLFFFDDVLKYGYEIVIIEIENLIAEVWSKTNVEDREEISKLRTCVMDALELRPIFSSVNIANLAGGRKARKLNRENWVKLRDFLFHYHMRVNVLLEKAGYNTLSVEDDPDDPYN